MAFVKSNTKGIFRTFATDGVSEHFVKLYKDNPDGWRSIIQNESDHSATEMYHMGIWKDYEGEYREANIYGFFNEISMYCNTEVFVDDEFVVNPDKYTLQDFLDGHVYARLTRNLSSYRSGCDMCGGQMGYEIWANAIKIMTIDEGGMWSHDKCDPVNCVQFTIPVPSGRIVFGDFLGSFKGEDGFETGDADINRHLGRVSAIMHNARRDMAAFCVGNSCPGVYRTSSGKFMVSSGMYLTEEDLGEEYYLTPEQAEEDGGEYNTEVDKHREKIKQLNETFGEITREDGICTDLWWASFMDESLAKENLEETSGRWDGVLEVEPGLFQFNVYTMMSPWCQDDDYSRVYATFERIGDL